MNRILALLPALALAAVTLVPGDARAASIYSPVLAEVELGPDMDVIDVMVVLDAEAGVSFAAFGISLIYDAESFEIVDGSLAYGDYARSLTGWILGPLEEAQPGVLVGGGFGINETTLAGGVESLLQFQLRPTAAIEAGEYHINLQFSNSASPSDATGLFNVDGDPLQLTRTITNGIDPGVDGLITVRSSSVVIPEPGSVLLAGLGIAGVAGMALRRRAS
jgi:hypothetical protein